jgi:hypothetical protein
MQQLVVTTGESDKINKQLKIYLYGNNHRPTGYTTLPEIKSTS